VKKTQDLRLEAADMSADLVDWALGAHTLARENAYKIPADHQLDTSYVDDNQPIVDQQLAFAGLRLSKVLNDTFAPASVSAHHHPH